MPVRRNNEGNVYNCSWKKTGGEYVVWVESDEELRVRSVGFDEAEDELCELICEHFGDGEAVLEFNPPPPVSNRTNWTQPEIVSIGYNASAELVDKEQPLFSGGRCPVCRIPKGDRTTASIKLKHIIR